MSGHMNNETLRSNSNLRNSNGARSGKLRWCCALKVRLRVTADLEELFTQFGAGDAPLDRMAELIQDDHHRSGVGRMPS